jgi:hypothetical protein
MTLDRDVKHGKKNTSPSWTRVRDFESMMDSKESPHLNITFLLGVGMVSPSSFEQ